MTIEKSPDDPKDRFAKVVAAAVMFTHHSDLKGRPERRAEGRA